MGIGLLDLHVFTRLGFDPYNTFAIGNNNNISLMIQYSMILHTSQGLIPSDLALSASLVLLIYSGPPSCRDVQVALVFNVIPLSSTSIIDHSPLPLTAA